MCMDQGLCLRFFGDTNASKKRRTKTRPRIEIKGYKGVQLRRTTKRLEHEWDGAEELRWRQGMGTDNATSVMVSSARISKYGLQ
mmetsp:Transcript_16634/g.20734  ORF Transcript_16634/g.20734 Transcript_16634/m.20734 type:complete len:84 (+) Transcript_16634:259-510(+)